MYDKPTSVLGSLCDLHDLVGPTVSFPRLYRVSLFKDSLMYSFPYLVGQYLLYHVAKTINSLCRSLRARIVRRRECVCQSPKIPQPQAKQQLEQLLNYTLHKPRRRRFPTLPTKVFSNNEQFVMDLVDIQTLAKYNKGYKYLLTVIDVFSKYAWVEPLKCHRLGRSLRKTMDKVRSSPTSENTDGFWR